MNEDTTLYEIGFHIVPSIGENDVEAVVGTIKNAISEQKGTIVAEESPKITPLAYEISKRTDTGSKSFDKAYFGWIKFEVEAGLIAAIQDFAKAKSEILRFLIIKTDKENTVHYHKLLSTKRSEDDAEEGSVEEGAEEKIEEVKDTEIDKTIDNLIVA